MTNPHPLPILTEVREAKSVSLAEMASACGLSGTQSRKTASDWEQGIKKPKKERRLAFMWYLWGTLGLKNNAQKFEEVWKILEDEWRWDPINEAERESLRKGIRSNNQESALPEQEAPKRQTVLYRARKFLQSWIQVLNDSFYKRSRLERWVMLGGATAIIIILLGLWFINIQKNNKLILDDLPIFNDEFDTNMILTNKWDLTNLQGYGSIQEGRLLFDVPQNKSHKEEWLEYDLPPRLNINVYISRTNFDVMLPLSADQKSGYMGVEADCSESGGQVHVYVGGTPSKLMVEYTPDGTGTPYKRTFFDSIVSNRIYNIDLSWRKEGIEVSLDGHKQGDTLPCLSSTSLNLVAGVNQDESIKGYIDNFQVWGKVEK